MPFFVLACALATPAALSADADASVAADSAIAAAVASASRSDKDRERDAREKPAEVLAFAGLRPGMTVADIFGGGGYYSELFSQVVGPRGRTLLVNNVPYMQFAKDDLKARFAEGRLSGVERSVIESCDLKLGRETLDLAVIVMSYHDLYYVDPLQGWPEIDAANFLRQIHAALKPGGRFLIVDHAARVGTGKSAAQDLHRIDEEFARRDLASHGFVFDKSYEGLRNAADDRSKLVFDPSIRGKTDRFVHLYRKR
jgi:predicted methyltransferase